MINAEKLLGGLVRQAISGGGRRRGRRRRRRRSGLGSMLGGGLGGAAGLGVLGVAIAAFEHFSQRSGQSAQPASPPQSTPPSGPPPRSTPPPPPPGPAATAPPPPPGAQPAAETDANQTAALLIQAMIAAANADGRIDPVEEREILQKLDEAGMSLEEREFILRQMADPPTLDSLLPKIGTPELAKQVYAVSLLAIDVDTAAEREYMRSLRDRLKIDEATAAQLDEQFGASEQ